MANISCGKEVYGCCPFMVQLAAKFYIRVINDAFLIFGVFCMSIAVESPVSVIRSNSTEIAVLNFTHESLLPITGIILLILAPYHRN